MSDPANGSAGGLLAALRRGLDGGLGLVQNRVELFAVELREEQCRLVEIVILAAALVAVGMLAFTLLTLLLVVAFWDSARLQVIGGLIVVYAGAGLLVWRRLDHRLKAAAPFSATLDQIKKDRACFTPES